MLLGGKRRDEKEVNKEKLTLHTIRTIIAKLEIQRGGGSANVPGDFQSIEIAPCICAVMSANGDNIANAGCHFPLSIILGYDEPAWGLDHCDCRASHGQSKCRNRGCVRLPRLFYVFFRQTFVSP